MAEKDLAVLAAESHTNGAHSVRSFVRVGHAPNEITKTAKDLDVDLIIIATHGYTSWRHFCIGSTAERVVRTAPCPGTSCAKKSTSSFNQVERSSCEYADKNSF